ncbi:MAG: esterase-like activity of phytase family protein [Synechococcaceae cyanobacterium SM2_3_1]|nr:esterase-like activity of phytase family protein [Synechococcaceae cyanobacterium SM2_3_1]
MIPINITDPGDGILALQAVEERLYAYFLTRYSRELRQILPSGQTQRMTGVGSIQAMGTDGNQLYLSKGGNRDKPFLIQRLDPDGAVMDLLQWQATGLSDQYYHEIGIVDMTADQDTLYLLVDEGYEDNRGDHPRIFAVPIPPGPDTGEILTGQELTRMNGNRDPQGIALINNSLFVLTEYQKLLRFDLAQSGAEVSQLINFGDLDRLLGFDSLATDGKTLLVGGGLRNDGYIYRVSPSGEILEALNLNSNNTCAEVNDVTAQFDDIIAVCDYYSILRLD